MTSSRHRIAYIDGLRAVAVLIVVASHAVAHSAIGALGVELFFVISGFCLSYPTLAKLGERKAAELDLPRYAARRVVRIVPPYWIAIAVLFAAALFIPDLHRVSGWQVPQQALFDDYKVDYLAGTFWTLPIEFRWYFFFPVALLLWQRYRMTFFTVAITAGLIGLLVSNTNLDLLFLPGFMLGIVAAHIAVNGHRLARWALPAFGVCLLATCSVTKSLFAPLWHVAGFVPALEAMMFLFVVGAGSSLWLNRCLSTKWLTAVGLASYSIYLVHLPVSDLAIRRGVNPILAALLGIGVGFAFWYAAERPFVEPKLRNRLVSWLERAFTRWLPRVGIRRRIQFALTPRDSRSNRGDDSGSAPRLTAALHEGSRFM
jgi:peptidoglycan/LPS O-acetylase OafA/YrhL